MKFGKRLKQLRVHKGLTLRTLAEAVDLDFTYLSKIENEKVDYTPSADKIRALAQALDADELGLLELAGKVPPELEAIARIPSARAFFRRARQIDTADGWNDLLEYLEKQAKVRKSKKK